jgi:chorismate mutase / prephenate dehydrogenase
MNQTTTSNPELTKIRKEIDEIDNELINMISKRINLIPQVAEIKKQNNIPRYIPERETKMLENRRDKAKSLNINPDLIEDIFKGLIKESHEIEEKIIGK